MGVGNESIRMTSDAVGVIDVIVLLTSWSDLSKPGTDAPHVRLLVVVLLSQ